MSIQDIKKYGSICLKLMSLGLVLAAGSFWAGSGVESRPKYRDEQTLIGGAIWSQIIIPIGLIISRIVGEELAIFIHGYYLLTGTALLFCTGLTLIIHECLVICRQKRAENERRPAANVLGGQELIKNVSFKIEYDKVYLTIGILSLVAGIFTFSDFILVMI